MEDESGGVLSQNFPDEIVMEILIRLPVKSLLRFRSVSKSWLYLISTKAFTDLHLKSSVANSQYSRSRLLCVFNHPDRHFREYSLHLMLHQPEVNPMILDYAVDNSNLIMRIVGSILGMVCIALGDDYFILWNPSIRKYKCLPCLHIWSRFGCYVKDGFGYVEETNDYKVVCIAYSLYEEDEPYRVFLYSWKSNTWKRIEDFNPGFPLDDSAKYAHGKLHWLVDCDGSLDIVSLDLITERYETMGSPDAEASRDECLCMSLGLFSGKLCALFDDHRARMDLWVMEEYGVRESWTRVLVVSSLGICGHYPHMMQTWSLNNGKIFLLYDSIVAVYNPMDGTWYFPEVHETAQVYMSDVYVESLICP